MRALLCSSTAPAEQRPLRMVDLPIPEPEGHQVVVRVRACGVCRTDLHVVEGDLPARRSAVVPGHQIVGEVCDLGADVYDLSRGDRVGVAWLHRTCGLCRYCLNDRENLCDGAEFTGWTVHGGFAEYVLADAAFTYRLPDHMSDLEAAPLLCAGIIGYRCLEQTGILQWRGVRLGIYGFGAAGHVALQIARARGAEVYVCTRDQHKHRELAEELGATWTGRADERPPVLLDASIIFAPSGDLVPPALSHLDRGGALVLGGIHMTDIPSFPYALLYRERSVRSVANNTRADGRQFLEEAASIGVQTHVEGFPLDQAHEALIRLKTDGIRGAAVLLVDP